MLTRDCWSELLSEIAEHGEVQLEQFVESTPNCGSVSSIRPTLEELEELGWIELDADENQLTIRFGWKADLFHADDPDVEPPTSQPE